MVRIDLTINSQHFYQDESNRPITSVSFGAIEFHDEITSMKRKVEKDLLSMLSLFPDFSVIGFSLKRTIETTPPNTNVKPHYTSHFGGVNFFVSPIDILQTNEPSFNDYIQRNKNKFRGLVYYIFYQAFKVMRIGESKDQSVWLKPRLPLPQWFPPQELARFVEWKSFETQMTLYMLQVLETIETVREERTHPYFKITPLTHYQGLLLMEMMGQSDLSKYVISQLDTSTK